MERASRFVFSFEMAEGVSELSVRAALIACSISWSGSWASSIFVEAFLMSPTPMITGVLASSFDMMIAQVVCPRIFGDFMQKKILDLSMMWGKWCPQLEILSGCVWDEMEHTLDVHVRMTVATFWSCERPQVASSSSDGVGAIYLEHPSYTYHDDLNQPRPAI